MGRRESASSAASALTAACIRARRSSVVMTQNAAIATTEAKEYWVDPIAGGHQPQNQHRGRTQPPTAAETTRRAMQGPVSRLFEGGAATLLPPWEVATRTPSEAGCRRGGTEG